jgi:hypothetical protein
MFRIVVLIVFSIPFSQYYADWLRRKPLGLEGRQNACLRLHHALSLEVRLNIKQLYAICRRLRLRRRAWRGSLRSIFSGTFTGIGCSLEPSVG